METDKETALRAQRDEYIHKCVALEELLKTQQAISNKRLDALESISVCASCHKDCLDGLIADLEAVIESLGKKPKGTTRTYGFHDRDGIASSLDWCIDMLQANIDFYSRRSNIL
jgi:hypothetical protein